MTEDLKKVNEFRKGQRRLPQKTPGKCLLVRGKQKGSFWGDKKFEKQVVHIMDVSNMIHPIKQLLLEENHSVSNTKSHPDGLHVFSMSVKYRGKKMPRDFIVIEG